MRRTLSRVTEIRTAGAGRAGVYVTCPAGSIPEPGQYALAYADHAAGRELNREAALAVPLFPMAPAAPWPARATSQRSGKENRSGFWAAPPIPETWEPGSLLVLRGPIGHGFHLPGKQGGRIVMLALGEHAYRLTWLAISAVQSGAAVVLISDTSWPLDLPTEIEISPIAALPEALSWAEYLALDLPLDTLPRLRETLGVDGPMGLPCPAEGLVFSAMPCGGLAECGVCAVKGRAGWRLICIDGPVFDLQTLAW